VAVAPTKITVRYRLPDLIIAVRLGAVARDARGQSRAAAL